jgi:hypothetical protein
MPSRSIAPTLARAVLGAAAVLLAACGSDTPTVPQAAATQLLAPSIATKQTGDAPVRLVENSVSWKIDDAKLVNVSLVVHSTAGTAVTVTARASLYDKDGKLVGDATGGALQVQPNSNADLHLTGPTPNGTVSTATFEFTTIPSATPVPK